MAIGEILGGIKAGAGIVSGIKSIFGGKSPEQKAAEEALYQYDSLGNIDWNKTLPLLKAYQAQQVEDPTLEADRAAVESAMANLPETDPRLKKAQMDALTSMQRRGSEGLTLSDRADLEKLQMDAARAGRGSREALLQRAAASGQPMGAAALSLAQQAEQDTANQAAQRSLEIAAMRQQAKRDALAKAGGLASDFRTQEFNEQSSVASAKDALAKFNEQNAANRAMRNVKALRDAQASRLEQGTMAEQSRIAAENAMAKNRAAIEEKKYQEKVDRIDKRLGYKQVANKAAADARAQQGLALDKTIDAASSLAGSGLFKPAAKTQEETYGKRNTNYADLNLTTGNTDE